MSINITYVKITGITRPNTLMLMHNRIRAAIGVSTRVKIEGQIIEEYEGVLAKYRLIGHYHEADVVSDDLMFLLGCLAQRIFNHRPVEDGSDYKDKKAEVNHE